MWEGGKEGSRKEEGKVLGRRGRETRKGARGRSVREGKGSFLGDGWDGAGFLEVYDKY